MWCLTHKGKPFGQPFATEIEVVKMFIRLQSCFLELGYCELKRLQRQPKPAACN
ncbi:hypothetical protein [Paenibacillus sp. 481]|uniref:hypothetical protein n=1 Tax=Paenibacillus sp. 481 TaxID=2835869 RepID=UPI001E5C5B66|nr:hypothetical protein [Paenibacillus sp. 481]UHA75532.1 hypothetical protein KIK04_11365 [Paenibacillus sp. 481]